MKASRETGCQPVVSSINDPIYAREEPHKVKSELLNQWLPEISFCLMMKKCPNPRTKWTTHSIKAHCHAQTIQED